jgi:glycosyltransferase involved in cell wall biosynthesis
MTKLPTLGYVDHSFHKKTKSGEFLREILRPYFELTDLWDESWQDRNVGPVPVAELNRYDYLFYFQVLNDFTDLEKVTGQIIWAPMYDSVTLNPAFWRKLLHLNIKIICFSKKIFRLTQRLGLDSIYLQYYKEPQFSLVPGAETESKKLEIFFWYRGNIKFATIKNLLDDSVIQKIRYLALPDPGYSPETISLEDQQKFKVEIITADFLDQATYLKLFNTCDIFVSPRRQEGIGMSFVEALARGQVVIGYDDATMNEYITNGQDGYLLNDNSQPFDLQNFTKIQASSRQHAVQGWQSWQNNKHQIIDFIAAPAHHYSSTTKVRLWLNFLWEFTKSASKFISKKIRQSVTKL